MESILKIIDYLGVPVILTFILVLFSAYYIYSTWNYNYWKKQGVIGDTPWPIVGTLKPYQMFETIETNDMKKHKKYGRIYGGFEGRIPTLYVIEPEIIKQVMIKDFPTFTNRKKLKGVESDPLFSKMLTLIRGEEWKKTRTAISPSFTTGKLKQMTYLIEECIKVLVKFFDKVAVSNQPIDFKLYFSAFTLDVIASCAFAVQTNSLENPDNEFVTNARKSFQSPPFLNYLLGIFPQSFVLFRAFTAHFLGNPFQFFMNVADKMITLRMENKMQSRKDFLDFLIEAQAEEEESDKTENENMDQTSKRKKVLTRDSMISNIVIFLLAGNDTTATTLSFFAYCLATNPHCQEKLIQEIDEVMTDCKGNLTYEIIMGLQYLDMALSEVLRLYPPLVRVERECGVDGHKIGNIVLQKRTMVATSVFSLHRDEEFYPNPEIYDPERFSPENKSKRHSCAYIPFGIGPRNCIAMRFALTEIKLTMAYLLSQFRFTTCDKTECPIRFSRGFGLLAPKSVTLQLQKRVDQPSFDNAATN